MAKKNEFMKDGEIKEGTCSIVGCGCQSTHNLYGTDGIQCYTYPLCPKHANYYRKSFEVHKD